MENIILNHDSGFTLIDPRPLFGESQVIGDLYYELAKLDHGLLVNASLMRQGRYSLNFGEQNLTLSADYNPNQLYFREIIYKKLGATALFRDSHYFIGENRGRLV